MRPFVILLLATLLTGCSPFETTKSLMWWKEDEPRPPAKITPMWTDTVMYQPGMAPVRGFGGRVMFFDNHSEDPIKVEGTLTVYAFDGTSPETAGTMPERKYVFPAEDLEKHFSESKLGPSYSFWLPWDEVGGRERQLTLLARFEPLAGGPTMSQPSRHYLPGLPAPQPAANAPPAAQAAHTDGQRESAITRHAVQPVSFLAPEADEAAPRMSTVTIDVPPSFIRHTQGENPADEAASNSPIDAAPPMSDGTSAEQGRPTEGPHAASPSPPANAASEAAPLDAATMTIPRRERVRRQPYRATWLPALPHTPRTQTADRWPGQRPMSNYGDRSWSNPPSTEQPSPASASPAPASPAALPIAAGR